MRLLRTNSECLNVARSQPTWGKFPTKRTIEPLAHFSRDAIHSASLAQRRQLFVFVESSNSAGAGIIDLTQEIRPSAKGANVRKSNSSIVGLKGWPQ
jgi:hypothetical protein